jgi:hypothetical protein
MGGFFSPPSPPPPPPPPVVQTVDPAVAETQARQDAVDRARRGMAGTVATSDRGQTLQPLTAAPTGKTLLGD